MSNYKWKMKSYWAPTLNLRSNRLPLARFAASEPFLHSLEIQINHRRQIEGHDLRNAEPAHDGQSQSAPGLRAGAPTQGDRQGSHQRRHRRHHDWPESDQARLKDRFLFGGPAQRNARFQVERNRGRRQLAQVVNQQRTDAARQRRHRAQRNQAALRRLCLGRRVRSRKRLTRGLLVRRNDYRLWLRKDRLDLRSLTGTCRRCRRMNIETAQRGRILLILGLYFKYHFVFIRGRVDSRYLARAISIVERVFNLL